MAGLSDCMMLPSIADATGSDIDEEEDVELFLPSKTQQISEFEFHSLLMADDVDGTTPEQGPPCQSALLHFMSPTSQESAASDPSRDAASSHMVVRDSGNTSANQHNTAAIVAAFLHVRQDDISSSSTGQPASDSWGRVTSSGSHAAAQQQLSPLIEQDHTAGINGIVQQQGQQQPWDNSVVSTPDVSSRSSHDVRTKHLHTFRQKSQQDSVSARTARTLPANHAGQQSSQLPLKLEPFSLPDTDLDDLLQRLAAGAAVSNCGAAQPLSSDSSSGSSLSSQLGMAASTGGPAAAAAISAHNPPLPRWARQQQHQASYSNLVAQPSTVRGHFAGTNGSQPSGAAAAAVAGGSSASPVKQHFAGHREVREPVTVDYKAGSNDSSHAALVTDPALQGDDCPDLVQTRSLQPASSSPTATAASGGSVLVNTRQGQHTHAFHYADICNEADESCGESDDSEDDWHNFRQQHKKQHQ